jgi:dihydrodipicolinate synthase/N-acetylneuraminate lyase
MKDFKGVYPAFATPMNKDESLNEEAFRKVMDFNIDAGAKGFWVAGGSGESVLLDDEENNRIAEISAEQAAGRAKIIMHVGAATTKRAAKMAEYAAKAGVEAICCVPPFFYRQSDEAIAEHYRVVAAAADLPLFVYNLPQATGVEITPPMMAKIQEKVPQLEGLKHSAMNQMFVREFINMGLSCFIGNARLMLPAMTMGAVGLIDWGPNLVPEIWVELYDAFQAGDLKRALAAQDKGIEVTKLAELGSFHQVLKAGLSERLGVDCGAPRAPGPPMDPENRKELRRRLIEMGYVKS